MELFPSEKCALCHFVHSNEHEVRWGPAGSRGSKKGKDQDIVETCFALLFLKRATVPTTGVPTGK